MVEPTIRPIPAFTDNYIWCIDDGRQALIVDPGDATPVIDALRQWRLQLTAILLTHHHFDHVGGVPELVNADLPVIGPADSSPHLTRVVAEGEQVELLGLRFGVMNTPGHTLDHIAYYTEDTQAPSLFCGDTLFAGGCGRLFEGTPEQMHHSLERLMALPGETRVYCAHEYTEANLRFASAVEPDSVALSERRRRAAQWRAEGQPTVPSSLDEELRTNPFLRSTVTQVRDAAEDYAKMPLTSPVETFAAVRRWKDAF